MPHRPYDEGDDDAREPTLSERVRDLEQWRDEQTASNREIRADFYGEVPGGRGGLGALHKINRLWRWEVLAWGAVTFIAGGILMALIGSIFGGSK